jgi:hypothetical protein
MDINIFRIEQAAIKNQANAYSMLNDLTDAGVKLFKLDELRAGLKPPSKNYGIYSIRPLCWLHREEDPQLGINECPLEVFFFAEQHDVLVSSREEDEAEEALIPKPILNVLTKYFGVGWSKLREIKDLYGLKVDTPNGKQRLSSILRYDGFPHEKDLSFQTEILSRLFQITHLNILERIYLKELEYTRSPFRFEQKSAYGVYSVPDLQYLFDNNYIPEWATHIAFHKTLEDKLNVFERLFNFVRLVNIDGVETLVTHPMHRVLDETKGPEESKQKIVESNRNSYDAVTRVFRMMNKEKFVLATINRQNKTIDHDFFYGKFDAICEDKNDS